MMNKLYSITMKIITIFAIVSFTLLFVYLAYLMHMRLMPIWQIIVVISGLIISGGSLAYIFIRANRNNSPADIKRDKVLLGEITDIKQNNKNPIKTTFGKWYFVASMMIIFFPIFAFLVNQLAFPYQIKQNIILTGGCIMIITFIIGIRNSIYKSSKK